MDFIKKNWLVLVLAVVAVAAIVAVTVIPLPGMFSTLDQEVEARAAKAQALITLRGQARQYPDLELDGGEPRTLDIFPTAAAVEVGKQAVAEFQEQADDVLQAAKDANYRSLLVPNSLPLPQGSSSEFIVLGEFQREYIERMNLTGTTYNQSLAADPLQGTPPLTGEELEAERLRITTAVDDTRVRNANTGEEVNKEQADQRLADQLEDSGRILMFRKANNYKMYVEPGAFDVQQQFATSQTSALDNVDVFRAQLTLWVQEDLAAGMALANEEASNILDAPVKHLLAIDVQEEALVGGDRRSSAAAEEGVPTLPVNNAAQIEPDYDRSVTGRSGNPMYDVVPFTLRLRVAADDLPAVLADLSTNRLITIRNVAEFEAVDSGVALADGGYVYGDSAVVEVLLEGESLFLRTWLAEYMPESVKAAIAAATTVAPAE